MTAVEKMFQEVTPFWDSDLSGEGEEFKALWDEYAYLDIEILRRADPEVQKLIQRQVAVRKELDVYRDKYYFNQGGDRTAKKMGLFLRNLQATLEILVNEEDPPSE